MRAENMVNSCVISLHNMLETQHIACIHTKLHVYIIYTCQQDEESDWQV